MKSENGGRAARTVEAPFHVRIPRKVAERLLEIAAVNRRSATSEAIVAIERHVARERADRREAA